MTEYKTCKECLQILAVDNFYLHSTGKYYAWCKECHRIKKQKIRKKYPETYRSYSRRIYHLDPEISRARAKEYRDKYPERHAASFKKWATNNPEKSRERGARRRVRLENNGIYTITSKEKKRLYNSPCFYCGSKESIQLDHVIPVARGGRHSIGNLVAACFKCNNQKKARFIMEWKLGLSGPRRIVKSSER